MTETPRPSDGGTFSIYIGEPENPLVPGNTTESEGSQVIDALWTGLVQYSTRTARSSTPASPTRSSPTTTTTWTIKLKDGWTFHDGTPVDAQSFVDAWNYTALQHERPGRLVLLRATSRATTSCRRETDDAGNVTTPPAAKEMTGLKVVDDQTFTVTLTAPFAQYPVTVGYNAFYPLPEAFFDGPRGRSARSRSATARSRPTSDFVPGQGITADPVRRLRR